MIGCTLSHYKITAKVGEGGMGEVYRANDTKLGRDVALKVLPAEMASNPERLERFQREAKALAALDHPGIVGVYSVEESDGVHFLTMQLVEGQPLNELIPESGLPVGRMLEIATGLAEALAAAHDKGIVHRDLKPANVMVAKDGRVKVLDFGLARMSEAPAEVPGGSVLPTELLTREGVVMGTVPYMSPEQVSGVAVDHRTDIFSLGVILYEMATGWRPFQGRSSAELASEILRDSPRPLGELRADLPDELVQVIERCLEKSVADRLPSARALCEVLGAVPSVQPSALAATALASRPATSADSGAARAEEGFWVAVLPFKYKGADTDLAALAEGLSEEIVTGLSRFSYLRVIARSSTERYAGEAVDVRSVGKEIGARYVMEGSLRQAGSMLRVAVQLVDASTGAHLWAETYDRAFSPEAVFEMQDALVPRIVSTVADMHGILPRGMSETVRLKAADQLTPYEALLHSFGYNERFTPEALAEARSCLERAVEQSPGNADCWAMLSLMYSNEYGHWDIQTPESFEKALQAARKAVLVAPLNSLPYYALAQAHFFRREFPAARSAAERAVSLNPMDGATAAFMGLLIAYSGDWERGCELADRALELNPNLPGMYYYTRWHDAYGKKDYRRALELALKLNTPDSFYQHAVLAMCYAQLGEMDAAHKSLQDMLAIKADYGKVARKLHGKWVQPDLVEQLMDGLRKAGLEVADEEEEAAPSPARPASGERRADEGFWVAVLPFKYKGADADLAALAEGLSEEIVTGLSRFSYLRVIARSSTERYSGELVDVRSVGETIGARYVMEGSLRPAGSMMRLAVQLIDASTGAHLWTESYDRTFSPEKVLTLQDDLVPRIVSTVADWYGALPHSMSEAVRLKPPDQLSSYEAVLRSFGYFERITPEEHAAMRAALERAVEQAPGNADGWAMLSMMYGEEHRFGFNLQPDPLGRSLRAARRAVDAAHANHFAWLALAQALFFRREFDAFRDAAERAIALNPMDGSTLEYLGHLMAFSGDWEGGCEVAERARHLNPNHPGWYWTVHYLDHYRQGNYLEARPYILKTVLRGGGAHVFTQALLAAVHGQLGEREQAEQAVHDILSQEPGFAQRVREEFAKWYLPELVERLMEGLRKAGLDVPETEEAHQDATAYEGSAAEVDTVSQPSEQRDATVAIAVLPFSDMSPAKDQKYFCDGMAEEVMNALVGIAGIRVAARTSAFRASREGNDLAAIGDLLGVSQVLEGSVRSAGGRLRVTARLSDVETGFQLWSERYDRPTEDVFAVQDEIASGVVKAVEDRLGSANRAVCPRPQTRNLEAYRWYLKARYLRGKEDHEEARRAFEEAIRLDPSYAPSWTGMADVLVVSTHFGLIPPLEGCAAARQALATAAELEGESVEALHAEAFVAYLERRWQDMEATWRRALELQPTHILSLGALGTTLCTRRRFDEGMQLLERAREADPLSSFPCVRIAVGLLCWGRPEEALGYLESALIFDKEDLTALWTSCMAKVALGGFDEAIAEANQVVELSRRGIVFLGTLGWVLATAGRADEARAVLDELRERPADSPANVSEAWLLGGLGELDEAFELLDRAEEEYHPLLYYSGLPPFDSLRTDPRFAELLTRLELPSASSGSDSVVAPQATAETKSIVVLPFANLSPDPDTEYFSDGLTDEIITDLSRVRALRVISRSSAMRLKGDERDLAAIGRDLACRYVLEGSVRRAANSLRITARLVDTPTDAQLWADKYRGTLDDVFDIQERVSRSIVDALEIRLTPQEDAQIAERPIDDVRAQDSYLRARSEIWSFMPGSLDLAISHLEAALRLIGDNALVYQGLGEAYFQYVNIGAAIGREEELIQKAERCVDKIFELEPGSPRGHLVRAQIQMARGDIHGSGRSLRRVLEAFPREILALQLYTHALGWLGGKPEAAEPLAARLVDIDPLNAMSLLVSAMVPLFAGRFSEAVERGSRMFALDPVTPVWRANYVMALSYARRFDEAEALTEAVAAQPDSDVATWQMGLFRAAWRSDREEVLRLADGPYQQVAAWDAEVPWLLAIAHAAIGAKDEALLWLDRAIEHGMINYPFLSEHDWYLDGIRGEPRFRQAMERAKREWDRFEV